MKSKTNFHIYL